MEDVAMFIRYLTPRLTDFDRYSIVSKFHVLIQPILVFLFFYTKSLRLLFLFILFGWVVSELMFQNCFLTMIEEEFSTESWEDLLDLLFKKCGWIITRKEKRVGFTCFFIGIFVSFLLFTIYDLF
jgi:hypothetical protein